MRKKVDIRYSFLALVTALTSSCSAINPVPREIKQLPIKINTRENLVDSRDLGCFDQFTSDGIRVQTCSYVQTYQDTIFNVRQVITQTTAGIFGPNNSVDYSNSQVFGPLISIPIPAQDNPEAKK